MNKTLTIIFFLWVLLASCQKDFTINSPVTTQVTTDDSTLLSMIVSIDTAAPATLDTLEKFTYQYDNLKRLIKHEYVSYSNGVINPTDIFRNKYYYFYNGTDTLPFKQIDTLQENTSVNARTIFHTYQNEKIIFDSLVYTLPVNSIQVYKYIYFANKVVDTFIQYPISPVPTTSAYGGYRVNYRQTLNNNIITSIDSTFNYSTFATPFSYNFDNSTKETISYDNSKNPFYKFKNLNTYPYYNDKSTLLGNIDGSQIINQSINDPKNFQLILTFGSYTLTYNYEYKANGYPKVARIINNVVAPAIIYKQLFFYTN